MVESEKLRIIASEFARVLTSSSEKPIQKFLEQNVELFEFLGWNGFVKSQFRLADAFVPDFILVGQDPYSNALRPLVMFIEIERADEALFTRKGDPASFLTHAVKQTQDWKRWVTNNRGFLQRKLHQVMTAEAPAKAREYHSWLRMGFERSIVQGFQDRYLIIVGRREGMRIEDRLALEQMNHDLLNIRIITYDVLLDGILKRLAYTPPDND